MNNLTLTKSCAIILIASSTIVISGLMIPAGNSWAQPRGLIAPEPADIPAPTNTTDASALSIESNTTSSFKENGSVVNFTYNTLENNSIPMTPNLNEIDNESKMPSN